MSSSAAAQQKADQDMFTLIPHYSSTHEGQIAAGISGVLIVNVKLDLQVACLL
ncbi:MAG: hypothetical protein ACXU8A_00760 [Burkholderiaceae bacterium]